MQSWKLTKMFKIFLLCAKVEFFCKQTKKTQITTENELDPDVFLFLTPDVGFSSAQLWSLRPKHHQSRRTWQLEQPLRWLGLYQERLSTASQSSQWDRILYLPPPPLAPAHKRRTTCCLDLVILEVLSTQDTIEICPWCSGSLWGIFWLDGKPEQLLKTWIITISY